MNRFTIYSNAKINIGLNVYEKDEKGYHNIDSIMVPIDLNDEMEILFLEQEGDLKISCSDNKIPTNEENILYKVYTNFFEKIKRNKIEINIFLKKNIPTEAGLGGGSSNAASFLKILNEYFNNYFSTDELKKIAFEIGSDVPFFIENQTSRVSGKGEKLEKIKNNLESLIVLVKPYFGISTKEAYQNFDKMSDIKYSNLDEIVKAISENNLNLLEKNIENSLEQAMESEQNIVFLKNSLKSILPNKKFYMTGSGSTFYTFTSEKELDFLETRLRTFLDNVKIFICNIKK